MPFLTARRVGALGRGDTGGSISQTRVYSPLLSSRDKQVDQSPRRTIWLSPKEKSLTLRTAAMMQNEETQGRKKSPYENQSTGNKQPGSGISCFSVSNQLP
jgi:hypothetical protein